MAVITRSLHPDLYWPGIKALYGEGYEEFPPEWSQFFDEMDSDKAYEDIVEVSGFGYAPSKPEGSAIQYDIDGQGPKIRLTHTTYALGYQVTEEELEDIQYAQVSRRRAPMLGKSMRSTAETVHANILNNAFNGNFTWGDGQPLISTQHPTLGGLASNALAVNADFSEASLEDMRTLIETTKDRRGLPIMIRPEKLIVAPGADYNAERIVGSTLRPGTGDNDINVNKGIFPGGIVVDHYLTNPKAWFIKTNVDNGLVSMWRKKPGTLQQDNDFDTGNARSKDRMRFLAGVGDWRAIFGSI